MQPQMPLALVVMPELAQALAGDRAGALAAEVAGAVRAVTGTDDPLEAQRKLARDPALATALRSRLMEIALQRLRQGARSTLPGLLRSGSGAWGAPAVSVIVTGGFFVFLVALMLAGSGPAADPTVAGIVNIAMGALATAFATVVNFWLGSSQGSRSKDEVVARLQAAAQPSRPPEPSLPPPPPAEAPPQAPSGDALFERCLAVVLDKEGGFSDHRQDRGGPTNMGITWRTFAAWKGLAADALTAEQRERLVADLKALTRREAAEIYRANYWLPMRCGDLPAPAALMLFDFGVNAGPRTAVRALQRVAGVTADGSVGPKTLAAVQAMDPAGLVDQLAEARLAHYRGLADFATFGAGWTARTQQVAALARALGA